MVLFTSLLTSAICHAEEYWLDSAHHGGLAGTGSFLLRMFQAGGLLTIFESGTRQHCKIEMNKHKSENGYSVDEIGVLKDTRDFFKDKTEKTEKKET